MAPSATRRNVSAVIDNNVLLNPANLDAIRVEAQAIIAAENGSPETSDLGAWLVSVTKRANTNVRRARMIAARRAVDPAA